jgi:hypothetical protein
MNTKHALVILGLFLLSSPASAQKQKKVSQKEISRELRDMEEEEQRDQANWESLGDAEFEAAQVRRKQRTREIVAAGQLAKTADYYNAGMLLQHGQDSDDFLLAHILGTVAALDGDAGGKFLSAAALDRFLMSLGQPQYFKSQYGDELGREPVEPFDDTLSQTVVSIFGERAIRGGLRGRDVERVKKKELKAAGKDLKKRARVAGDLRSRGLSDPDAIVDAILASVVATSYVKEGKLDGPDDLLNAALVISMSNTEQNLTLAHILATAAAIEGHKEAPALFASTLDQLLVELKRAPVFGTVSVKAGEGLFVLHEKISKPFLGKKR